MEHPVDAPERVAHLISHRVDMLGNRHVELEDRWNGIEFAGRSLGERDRPTRPGQNHLRALGDRQFRDAEGE